MSKVRRQLIHSLITAVRTLLTALENDLFHAVGKIRDYFPRRRERILDMLQGNGDGCLSVVGYLAGQHLVQCHTQRIDITLLIAVASARLFRGGIMDRPHDIGGNGIAGGGLRDSEVRHLDFAFFGNDDILRLDIPVDNMAPVGSRQAHGDLDGNRYGLAGGKSLPLLNIPLERDAVHQFHDNVVGALFLADIINIDDIGVHQAGCGLRFYTELGDERRVLRKLLFEHLYSHHAVEPVVFCFIYIGHASGTNFFQYLIAVRNQHPYLNHFSSMPHSDAAARGESPEGVSPMGSARRVPFSAPTRG